jgi:hypothetical protein
MATACLALVASACQSTRPQPSSEGEQRAARLEAKVEHLSEDPSPPAPTTPATPPTPPALADHALLKAAGAPRAASLTRAEAHSFIRLKASIERANAAVHGKTPRSP